MKISALAWPVCLTGCSLLTAGSGGGTSNAAEPHYTALYVFGSSWADTRNGPHWQGHYSNGPMWPEFLSTNLGLAYVRTNNFAVGGSSSSVVLSQVTNFRSPANPERCLCHLWAGYTDFIQNPDSFSSDNVWSGRIRSWVTSISNGVVRLYAKGVRSIVVPNVFDRSREPWFIRDFGDNSASQALCRRRINEFNLALAAALEAIDRTRADLRLHTFDFKSNLDELMTNAAAYGFTKTFPGAADDPALSNKTFSGPGADYLFWDQNHATSKAHTFLAAWNLEALEAAVLERITISPPGQGALMLQMQKLQFGRDYTVQRSVDLGQWQDAHQFRASTGTNSLPLSAASDGPTFFRLKWTR
jgi:phospholipase/lecithinase/hemolysin